MDARKQHIESMIFDYITTTNTDFRKHDIRPTVKSIHKDKNVSRKKTKSPVKYVHTMTNWKKVPVPFDLLIENKQIVRTNPHHVQEPYEKPPDLEIDQIRRTRPRLVMTPAVSIDDIEDLEKRKLLVEDMYTTNVMKEFDHKCTLSIVRAPLRGIYAPANPVTGNCERKRNQLFKTLHDLISRNKVKFRFSRKKLLSTLDIFT